MKNNDRISQRQKAKNALFALAAQGVHPQGVNPLVSVGFYSTIVVPIALYGSELWSNSTASDLSVISRLQHYAAKRIQGLPTCTSSDMAESMVGLNRFQSQIVSRKLMFPYKILSFQQDELCVLYEYDSLTRTLKLLGFPLEPILKTVIESHLLSNVFKPILVKPFKQLM